MKVGTPMSSASEEEADLLLAAAVDSGMNPEGTKRPHHSAVMRSPYSPFAAVTAAVTEEELAVDPKLPSFTDVLILGAGPAGLALAYALTKLGVDHCVIDHGRIAYPADPPPDLEISLPTQGVLLQPSTLDLLHEMGVMDTLSLHGRPIQGATLLTEDRVMASLERFPKSTETRFQSAIVLEQWRLERILCDRLQVLQHSSIFRHHVAYKLIIRIGSTSSGTESVSDVSSLDLDPNVRAAYRVKVFIRRMDPVNRKPVPDSPGKWIRAKYVVGADGVRSITRRALEISTESLGPAREYLVADIVINEWGNPILQGTQSNEGGGSSLPTENHAVVAHSPAGSALLLPYNAPQHWRLIMERDLTEESLQAPQKDRSFVRLQIPSTQDIRDIVVQLVPGTTLDAVGWRTSYAVEPRIATTLYKERGIIVGDAARQDSPLWSSGVNNAIHDAVALGWRLAAVVNGGADESVLQIFSDERKKLCSSQIQFSIGKRDRLLDYEFAQKAESSAPIMRLIALAANKGPGPLLEALTAIGYYPPSITQVSSPMDVGVTIAASRVLGFAANDDSNPRALTVMQLARDGSHVLMLLINVLPLGTKHRTLFGCERKEPAPRYQKDDLEDLVGMTRDVLRACGQTHPIIPLQKEEVPRSGALNVKPVWVVCGLIDRSTMNSNSVLLTYNQLAKQVPTTLKSYILNGSDFSVPTYSVIDHEYELQDRAGLRFSSGPSWFEDISQQLCQEPGSRPESAGFILMRPDGRVAARGYPSHPEDRTTLSEYTNHYFPV